MLVISRRPGESLFIGDDIEIALLEISPSQVKLGIRAPRQVPVLRAEIRITADQNRAASQKLPMASLDRLRGSLTRRP
jgi:carbon storage regulator